MVRRLLSHCDRGSVVDVLLAEVPGGTEVFLDLIGILRFGDVLDQAEGAFGHVLGGGHNDRVVDSLSVEVQFSAVLRVRAAIFVGHHAGHMDVRDVLAMGFEHLQRIFAHHDDMVDVEGEAEVRAVDRFDHMVDQLVGAVAQVAGMAAPGLIVALGVEHLDDQFDLEALGLRDQAFAAAVIEVAVDDALVLDGRGFASIVAGEDDHEADVVFRRVVQSGADRVARALGVLRPTPAFCTAGHSDFGTRSSCRPRRWLRPQRALVSSLAPNMFRHQKVPAY